MQKRHAITKLPSALEYYSFLLNFQGLLAGPLVFYRDYKEFIEGNYAIHNYNAEVIKAPISNLFKFYLNLITEE